MSWEKKTTYTLRVQFTPFTDPETGEFIAERVLRMCFAGECIETHIFEIFYPPRVEGTPHPAAIERVAPGSRCFVPHDQLLAEHRQLGVISRAVGVGDFRGHTEERMVHEVYWQLHVHDILGLGILATFLPEVRAWADKTMRQLKEMA